MDEMINFQGLNTQEDNLGQFHFTKTNIMILPPGNKTFGTHFASLSLGHWKT